MEGSNNVKLLGSWSSPYVNRVQIALNIKSIEYELLQENLASKSELLLKSNPVAKKIPVLIHADKPPICESLFIIQYIDEVWNNGPSILPADPYDRAVARFWAAYIDDKWFPLVRELTVPLGEEEKAAVVVRIVEGLVFLEEVFVESSKGKGGYFGGESIGYLDIALGSFLGWMRTAEKMAGVNFLDKTTTPGLLGWVDRLTLNDDVKDIVPTAEKLIQALKPGAKASSK